MERKNCESCGIIFREKDIIIGGIETKKAPHNTHSEENPDRCIDCVDYEEKIKTVCVCGNHIRNTASKYLLNGNMCSVCLNRVNKILDLKKDLSYATGLRSMMERELENRQFNRKIEENDKETKPKVLSVSLSGFTDKYLKEKLAGNDIEKDIQRLKDKIDIIYRSISIQNN